MSCDRGLRSRDIRRLPGTIPPSANLPPASSIRSDPISSGGPGTFRDSRTRRSADFETRQSKRKKNIHIHMEYLKIREFENPAKPRDSRNPRTFELVEFRSARRLAGSKDSKVQALASS
ncbi:hypothetical protein DBV15_07717 [Temnothorax longispinosus]|uniref:Uncharacterized protein n=1 Tax=Temnothorax longispinosus TaxID=300112 RepID=A0A4V6RGL0_9HYME|nr:hypothetical protein DBV15_07717 [Temnothorax longispinosus]